MTAIAATLMVNVFVVTLNMVLPLFFKAKVMAKPVPASLMIPTARVACALLPNAVSE